MGKSLKGSGYGLIEILSVLWLVEPRVTTKNVGISVVPAEIRTEHLPKVRPEGDHCPNSFGKVYGFISTPSIRRHIVVFVSEGLLLFLER
jgi:hypothetical protein